MVDADGETRWLDAALVSIPHPVLLDDLEELRELALELDLTQGVEQLLREVHHKPAGLDPAERRVADFAGGTFAQLRHALARAGTLGFQVRAGYAVCRAQDTDAPVEARYWLGADDPWMEAWTGDLVWVDGRERQLTLGQVARRLFGGVRMASLPTRRAADDGEDELVATRRPVPPLPAGPGRRPVPTAPAPLDPSAPPLHIRCCRRPVVRLPATPPPPASTRPRLLGWPSRGRPAAGSRAAGSMEL